jgi:hypothetical protein
LNLERGKRQIMYIKRKGTWEMEILCCMHIRRQKTSRTISLWSMHIKKQRTCTCISKDKKLTCYYEKHFLKDAVIKYNKSKRI